MLEIVIIFVVSLLVAPLVVKRKPMKRRRYLRGNIDEDLPIGTLAAKDVVLVAFDETVNERSLVSSVVASYSISNFTPIATSGPIMVGIAHGNYTAVEIEAFIENTGSWSEGDKTSQEIAKRQIRMIGIFETPSNVTLSVRLNDGKPIKTKLNWILNQGVGLNLWAYNLGAAAVATTVPVIHAQGHANVWPSK